LEDLIAWGGLTRHLGATAQRNARTLALRKRIRSSAGKYRDSVLTTAQELQDAAQSKAQELRGKVEAYLRDTNSEELNRRHQASCKLF